MNVCIKRLLTGIDALAYFIAVCNGSGHLYETGKSCNLSMKAYYICISGPENITGLAEGNINTSLLKQRSDAWHEVRNQAKVTGSTCLAAIGLSGLKKHKEHFAHVYKQRAKEEYSDEVQKRLRHGTENEIHAVATLISKVLPVYQPEALFVEEGCETIKEGEHVLMIVSPDGSIRISTENGLETLAGVEIKCPYPGKLYTTPVHYELPWYYVTQVILEMHVLNVTQLYYLSYTSDSTTVFEIKVDEELLDTILECVKKIYGTSNPI